MDASCTCIVLWSVQVEQLVGDLEESGSSLEEAGQRVESYQQALEQQTRELEEVRGERDQLEEQVCPRFPVPYNFPIENRNG